MTERAPRQSAAEWSQIVAEFHQTGLSVEEFCTQRGYAASTFNRWRLRFSKQPAGQKLTPPVSRSGFVEALPAQVGPVTITLGESVRLECPLSLGIEHIARLAKAVAADEHV